MRFGDHSSSRDLVSEHLAPAVPPWVDQVGILGSFCCELRDLFAHGGTRIHSEVPRRCADLVEEPTPFVGVGNDLGVEVLGVPVDEHGPDVEDNGGDGGLVHGVWFRVGWSVNTAESDRASGPP